MARLVRDVDVIAQPSGEVLILFHVPSGMYFWLNECGSRIWELCDGTRTEHDISEVLIDEYDAPPEVRDDVSALLVDLTRKHLLKTMDQE
jgi:hypothetical protein